MDLAPPAGIVLVELVALVNHLQAQDVTLVELERAEGERFELARAEGVVGAEVGRDPDDRRGVAEPAVIGAEVAVVPARLATAKASAVPRSAAAWAGEPASRRRPSKSSRDRPGPPPGPGRRPATGPDLVADQDRVEPGMRARRKPAPAPVVEPADQVVEEARRAAAARR